MADIYIDPATRKDLTDAATEGFARCFAMASGQYDLDSLASSDIARIFYYNGFLQGAIEQSENQNLQEAVSLLKEETQYQINSQ